jgi:hypothetical protein
MKARRWLRRSKRAERPAPLPNSVPPVRLRPPACDGWPALSALAIRWGETPAPMEPTVAVAMITLVSRRSPATASGGAAPPIRTLASGPVSIVPAGTAQALPARPVTCALRAAAADRSLVLPRASSGHELGALGRALCRVAVGQRNGLVEKPQTRAGRLKTEVV